MGFQLCQGSENRIPRIWCYDLDEDKKGIHEVQSILVRFYHEVETPVLIWSDNGSQFASVIQAAVTASLGVRPKFIPPGRPQRAHGSLQQGDRRCLRRRA